jgi:hypothetical protein
VSGSTLTLGARVQVLNNPRIRLSGQPLQVNFNCPIRDWGTAVPHHRNPRRRAASAEHRATLHALQTALAG